MKLRKDPSSMLVSELAGNNNSRRLRRQRYQDFSFSVSPEYTKLVKDILDESRSTQVADETLRNQLLRTKADLDNFRKRTQREREDIVKRANENLVLDILTVLDNYERGLGSADELNGFAKQFIDGIKMTYNELLRVLSNYGLEKIDALGKHFDPYYHEAVGIEHNPELEDNVITDVLREGYKFQGKVIRPSMVKVNKHH